MGSGGFLRYRGSKESVIEQFKKDFFDKHLDNSNLLNSICKQIFFILAILQDKFEFMHKNFNFNNVIIKKYNHKSIKYKLKEKEYEINTYNYIPVLYNFSFSTIFKICCEDR